MRLGIVVNSAFGEISTAIQQLRMGGGEWQGNRHYVQEVTGNAKVATSHDDAPLGRSYISL